MIASILDRPKTGRRISEIKEEPGTTMNRYVAVFRDEAGLTEAHGIVRRLKENDTPAPEMKNSSGSRQRFMNSITHSSASLCCGFFTCHGQLTKPMPE